MALVARTAADARDVMVEGDSGILAVSPPWFMPEYEPSKRRLTWPNGAIATTYSSEKPEALRGPQHDGAWADELAAWRFADATWSNLMFGLRRGQHPRAVITTTPRPTPTLRALLANPHTITTRGTTYDNRANLAPLFYEQIIAQYEGTRLGRQELLAELLTDVPGALWTYSDLDLHRLQSFDEAPEMRRIVVGVDPQAGDGEDAAETGIIVAGLGVDDQGYCLDDRTKRGSPHEWGSAVAEAYYDWSADKIVAEKNNGGAMVKSTILAVDPSLPVHLVSASRGKIARAEPISTFGEQGRIHHVGTFAKLEDQLCTYTAAPGEESPDRFDAYVWAFTDLMVKRVREKRRVRVG